MPRWIDTIRSFWHLKTIADRIMSSLWPNISVIRQVKQNAQVIKLHSLAELTCLRNELCIAVLLVQIMTGDLQFFHSYAFFKP